MHERTSYTQEILQLAGAYSTGEANLQALYSSAKTTSQHFKMSTVYFPSPVNTF